MIVSEKLVKPVLEAKYLAVDNTDRYRPIIRLFFMNYEKLKYWLYQEEVYEELRKDSYFESYTEEQCQQDLKALEQWGNLLAMQDTKKVSTISEFKNRKFRYQLSEVTVEIERMVIYLENLHIEGSSLEPTLLERLRANLGKINEMVEEGEDAIYTWWKDWNNDFVCLNQNYQDYMRQLNGIKAEQMMKTKEFLVFKDSLLDYLRSFVKSLQMNVTAIEQQLRLVEPEKVQVLLAAVTAHEFAIPRIDVEVSEQEIYEKMQSRFQSMLDWFLGSSRKESEASQIFDMTNEIIRKITRYAARISEQSNSGANRREEYYKVATMFARCEDIYQAHRFSACVFGMEKPFHLKGEFSRQTQSMNSGVFDEAPAIVPLSPRTRGYKEKARRSQIVDRSKQKEEMRLTVVQQIEQERMLRNSYIKANRLEFARLPVLEASVRNVFLRWLAKALEQNTHRAKTEEGLIYYIEKVDVKEQCILQCEDGSFWMPAYTLIFEQADKGE